MSRFRGWMTAGGNGGVPRWGEVQAEHERSQELRRMQALLEARRPQSDVEAQEIKLIKRAFRRQLGLVRDHGSYPPRLMAREIFPQDIERLKKRLSDIGIETASIE